MKRPSYDELTIMPSIIAETVCQQPYTEAWLSEKSRSAKSIKRVEALRQAMPIESVQVFIGECDLRCRKAYEAKADWFEKIARSKTNVGRDQLYIWIEHWLAAYLTDEKKFLEESGL